MAKSTAKPNTARGSITAVTSIKSTKGGISSTNNQELPFEQHFSPSALGELWSLSPDFIRDRFRDEPGVVCIDRPETLLKQGYQTLRIPKSVAARVHATLRAA
jgi:hypothetical protein